jgi:corrinoid protein of di/trimethylamine methyltransferase
LPEQKMYQDLIDAVLAFDQDKLIELVRSALNRGQDPNRIIEDGLIPALQIVGKKFEDGEFFLVDLIAAADPVQKVVKELLEPEISSKQGTRKSYGKFVLGTVAGDIHDIGKNIVGAMLFAGGFEVFDLGKDVPAERFLAKAREMHADLVGASALLSTTLPIQREIVEAFTASGLRDKVKLIFGGAPATEQWVREIGGDGYAEDAADAVKLTKRLLGLEVQVA